MPPPRIAIDASPLMDRPLTGVGYRALYLLDALIARRERLDLRFVAARARRVPASEFPFKRGYSRKCILPWARRLKTMLWTRVNWPPIEWACGEIDVAHGMFHDCPATRRARRIATIHDLSFLLLPHTHTPETILRQTRLVRHAAARADALIAVSESCRAELIEHLDVAGERVHVVPGGIVPAEFDGELDADGLQTLKNALGLDGPYWLHLGTIEPRKNLPRLLEAYALLRERRADVPRLVLIGARGWLSDATFEALHRFRRHDDIVYGGYRNREETVLLLRGAAACVYPSLYEGFGLPVLEAMAAGTPVLTSTAGAVTEVAGGTCLHVDATEPEAIAGGLARLLDEPAEARARAAAARERAMSMTWDQSAAQLADVYRSLTEDQ
jgi:glycosyltransferase involved in cell wall biosynthesis